LLALPVVLWQLWAFVAPGLYSHEKKLVLPLVISSTCAVFRGCRVLLLLRFRAGLQVHSKFSPQEHLATPDIEYYLDFVLSMFLAFGLAFEVPVVVVVLARMGFVSIEKLKAFRSYFIVLAFVVAAIVTPPDVVSQLALAIPMCILYEIGIWAAQVFIKHTQAPEETSSTT